MLNLTMKNQSVHIKENPIAVGQTLEFQAINSLKGLQLIKLSAVKGKKIISSVPSIDTSTCALQTAKFNEYAAKNLLDYTIITISKDLPFAQNRFCSTLKLNNNFHIWSDYRNDSNNFANTSKLVIDETQLLARTVLILDENNKILYQQIVSEVSNEPNYEAVLEFIKKLG